MLLEKLNESPIVPVYYNDDVELCKAVMDQCYEGGVRVFEFVDRGSKSKENFQKLIDYRNSHFIDLSLGIGTIKNEIQARDFIALKADFLVSPIVNPAIAEVAMESSVEWIPGCMTPSEVALAEELGASVVKLFPGEVLGPNYIKAIKPLFSTLNFMVTGGVSLSAENLKSWFSAGAKAVGVGSKLFDGDFLEDKKDVVGNLKKSFDFIKSL